MRVFGAGEQATVEEVEKAVEVPRVEVAAGHRWVMSGWGLQIETESWLQCERPELKIAS